MGAEIDGGERGLEEREDGGGDAVPLPANVRTLRWCDESDVRSSSVTPGVPATTSARRVTTCGRRPSLTLGMHSINISSSWPMVFGPGGKGIIPGTGSGMSTPDAVRRSSTDPGARASDRLALIEQLLLAGLDHYFIGQYEQAIHVWTRVFFLDRGHARARAYIERARGALAEHQREAEARGAEEATAPRPGGSGSMCRRSALASQSAAAELTDTLPAALAAPPAVTPRSVAWSTLIVNPGRSCSRMACRGPFGVPGVIAPAGQPAGMGRGMADRRGPALRRRASGRMSLLITLAVVLLCSAAYVVVARDRLAIWWGTPAENTAAAPLANVEPEPLPLPRVSEQTLTRARSLFARGHLHEALQTLSAVGADDPLRRDADTLLIEVERALLDAAGVRAGSTPRPSPLSER